MNTEGSFVWYELMTTDPEAAAAFYGDVVGWGAADAGMPGMSYTILSADEVPVGGLMALPKEARESGARPGWMGYVDVDDGGGEIINGPMEVPGGGWIVQCLDPQGAMFALFSQQR